jgi:hypothetical protein
VAPTVIYGATSPKTGNFNIVWLNAFTVVVILYKRFRFITRRHSW